MKFQDIPAEILSIRMMRTDNAAVALQEQPVFSVESNMSRPDEFEIRVSDSLINARPVVAADIRRLNSELASGRTILAQFANPGTDGSIELQIAFFTGQGEEMGNVEIGVDEYVEQAVAKIARKKITGRCLFEALERHCCLDHGNQQYFFLTAGPAIDAALKSEPRRKPLEQSEEGTGEETNHDSSQIMLNTSAPQAESTRRNSFVITGDDICFIATATQLPDGKSVFIAKGLTKNRNDPDRALRLAKGKLTFVDWTQAGQIQILAKAQLSELTKDDGSYLKKWDKYGDHEGEILLKKAREIGALKYSGMKSNPEGTVSVSIDQASASAFKALAAKGVEEVELVNDLPNYLINLDLKFADFVSGLEQDPEYEKSYRKQKNKQNEERSYFKVSDFDDTLKSLTIKTENLPLSGTLILSLAGQIAQIKRRIDARKAILDGRSANPQLGLLIVEKGVIAPTRPSPKIKSLTAFVRYKVFPNAPPNLMQEKAIEVALNTPDIALIQGPPGTGKTTVIAAILERLNEMADKRRANIKGMVLLTGFQHDAVENMIDRLTLNSIPVPKFGKRSGADEEDFDVFEKKLESWCVNIAAELLTKNPQIAEIKKETEIRNLYIQYINTPTRTLATNLTKRIADLGITILGEETTRCAANLSRKLSLDDNLNAVFNPVLDAVRRLRIQAQSFADDGPERATDALDDLKDELEENERDLLDKASLWCNARGIPPFLSDLAALRKKLLISNTRLPVFRVEKHNDEVIALAEEAIIKIKVDGFSAKDLKSAALAEFLAELESNPYGMIDAVSDYSFAFSATCQQSVNKRMQRQKGIKKDDDDQKLKYDFVIVDEAARVSPRDLMIPMAQGTRIILVGDHRQLPHIVDENVIKELSEQDEDELLAIESKDERDDKRWSNISLFEYMFVNRLSSLEGQDGITRRVTLDTQYRMHPLLGDFVSRNFYERFDAGERFASGRPASDFSHDLPNTDGKAAIWLNVPALKGKHKRDGTSWTRRVEATAIAQQLHAWIKSAAGLCSSLEFSQEDDLVDARSFATKLHQRTRPIDAWLANQLTSQTQTAISACAHQNDPVTTLQKSLGKDLENVIKRFPVFDENRFEGVALRPEIRALLDSSPEGDDLVRLNRLLLEDAYPLNLKRRPLSFGVISFYKKQAELIDKLFSSISNENKRPRIGTVDSFQGMEFDVVFLSMVRTMPQDWHPRNEEAEKQAQGLFGHLCLYNRLNVSMSRQKKLLVVVGDSGLLKNALAEEFVPGLVDFFNLCKTEGKIL